MSGKTKIGVAPMLDISGSMYSALAIVKIDAKAFIQSALPGDQIGVITFNSTAQRIYPNSDKLVTVTTGLSEPKAAAATIDRLVTSGLTNMGDAIKINNKLLDTSTADVNAYVMLTDGYHNTGPDPNTVLRNNPALFIAALGSAANESHFSTLLAKNDKSKYYNQPNAWDMMQIFNDIRGLAPDVGVMSNDHAKYMHGANYTITESIISNDSEVAQFNAVWSDSNLQYTSNPSPRPGFVNVVLIDPNGKTTNLKPQITGKGYCIFNVNNCQPGLWRTLVQYDMTNANTYGTTAGFQFDTVVDLNVLGPNMVKAGQPIEFTAHVTDENIPVENLKITSEIIKPTISTKNALKKYSSDLDKITPDEEYLDSGMPEDVAKLKTLCNSNEAGKGLVLSQKTYQHLVENKDSAMHTGVITDTNEAGGYHVKVSVTGTNTKTGRSFSRTKIMGTLVTED